MPEERLTRQVLNSWAFPNPDIRGTGGNCLTTRRSLEEALTAAKLVPQKSGAHLASWMPQLAHPSAKKGIEDIVENLENRTHGKEVR